MDFDIDTHRLILCILPVHEAENYLPLFSIISRPSMGGWMTLSGGQQLLT